MQRRREQEAYIGIWLAWTHTPKMGVQCPCCHVYNGQWIDQHDWTTVDLRLNIPSVNIVHVQESF